MAMNWSTERPPENTIGAQLLKTLVDHSVDDISYEQMSRIARRLGRMSTQDRGATKRVAGVLLDELGPEKALNYIEKTFAAGRIKANDYYALRGFIVLPLPRKEVTALPAPWAGAGSQQLIQGQKRLQEDLGKIRDLGLTALEKPASDLNKDIQALRRVWGL